MKKIFTLIALFSCMLTATQSFAQMEVGKGTKFANLGIGLGGNYFFGSAIAFNGSFDIGVANNITVGPAVGFRSFGDGIGGYDIGARGSYHFNQLLSTPDALDLYAGLGLSFFGYTGFGSATGFNTTTIDVPIHLGGRYFFTEKLGGFAELGSAISTLKLGVTFKL